MGRLRTHFFSCLEEGQYKFFPSKVLVDDIWTKRELTIALYCFCRRPCIAPDLHELIECKICKVWYHRCCILAPEKAWNVRKEPWSCLICKESIAYPDWGGRILINGKETKFHNTCTIDNFLAILHHVNVKSDGALCNQLLLENKGPYLVVGEMLALMRDGRFSESKYHWAQQLGLMSKRSVIDFYGELQPFWMNAFRDLFTFESMCSDPNCDMGRVLHTDAFSFIRFVDESGSLQEKVDKFMEEYAAACSELALTAGSVSDLTRSCTGVRSYSKKRLSENVPFLSVNVNGVVQNLDELPGTLHILEERYSLIGAVQFKDNHFTGVIYDSDGADITMV